MGQREIVSISGACLTKRSVVGFQFIKHDGLCEAAGSFTITPGGPSRDVGELSGKFVIGQSFRVRGCRTCGNKFVYQCCECKKIICYDGREQRDVTCPACGKKSSIPASKDDRIVMSGKAGGGSAEIILAMDVSGSMSGDRITETKRGAIENFIRKCQGSRMALVTFGNVGGPEVRTDLNFTTDAGAMERAVSRLTAQGGTPSPFSYIIEEFPAFLRGTGNRYLVIFTDGEIYPISYVRGKPTSENIFERANYIKQCGVKIIAISCAGANKIFLSSIASPDAAIVTSDGKIGEAFATAASITQQG